MPRRYRPREVIRVLESLGWRVVRQRGSHVRLELPDGSNPCTVPTSSREVDPKTLGSILRQSALSVRNFVSAAEETL
jgi:predicted RNA binding protein YcfA (HicA-like mRNA interferase family)